MEQERIPIIGEKFPKIEANTTHGKISVPGDYRGKWFVLFSHPGDFTPVCTTEFYAFQKRYDYFKELDCELIGLSIDQVFSHIKWIEWIGQNLGQEIKFPIIADDQGRIAKLLNMIHPEKGSNTVRAVFIVDNIGVIRTILYYPQELGRNIDEILRIVKSLQIADQKNLAIPANWPNNEIIGSKGIIHPPKDEKTAKQRLESSKKGEIECKDWWFCYKKVFEESDYDLDTGKSKIKPSVYYLEQKDTEKKEYEKEADKKRETDKDTDRETFDFHKKRDIENPEALDNKDKEPEEKEFRRESYDRIRSEENIQEKYEKTPEENESEIYKGYKKQGLREEPVYELSDVEESSKTREVYEINPDRTGDYTFDTKPEIRNNLEETEKIQKDTEETEDKFQTTSEISEKPKEEKEIDDYTKRNSFMSLDKEKLKEDYYEETEDDYDLDEYDETEDEDDEERDRDFYRYKYGLDDDKTKEIGEETFFG